MDDIGDKEATAGLLRNQLARTLPKDSFLLDSVLMMMGRLGCDVRSLAGKSLAEVLLNPKSDIGLLRAIKDYSKQLSCTSIREAETAVATTIYYAALASSFCRKHSHASRDTTYQPTRSSNRHQLSAGPNVRAIRALDNPHQGRRPSSSSWKQPCSDR